jgi:flagellar biogenesis protein FliO
MGLDVLFGDTVPLAARLIFAFLTVLLLIGVFVLLLRRFGPAAGGVGGRRPGGSRLGVIEVATVDHQRRLVIVRRDTVEHLVMIGGPNDLLIEPGIVRGQPAVAPPPREERPAAEPAPRPTPAASAPRAAAPQVTARPTLTPPREAANESRPDASARELLDAELQSILGKIKRQQRS